MQCVARGKRLRFRFCFFSAVADKKNPRGFAYFRSGSGSGSGSGSDSGSGDKSPEEFFYDSTYVSFFPGFFVQRSP